MLGHSWERSSVEASGSLGGRGALMHQQTWTRLSVNSTGWT